MDGKMGEWEKNNLINELTKGRKLATQLQIQLNTPSSSSSHDQARGILVQNIISSYEKSLSMLNFRSSSSSTQDPQMSGLAIESPASLTMNPRSDQDSDRDVKDGSKKRWSQKVRVTPGTELEGSLDDGFSWRKYGQKDILGAKFPRGYYRCTHKIDKGCLATKQVQRSDEDPTIFEITYRGNHTCAQGIEPQQQQPAKALLNLKKGLKIVTQDLDINPQQPFPPSPSPSPSMVINSNFTEKFSPSFISPQASGSTNYNFQSSSSHYSELNEIISSGATTAAGASAVVPSTSATNSPTVGLDFPFDDIEYEPNFTFDNLGLFSSFQFVESFPLSFSKSSKL